MGKFMIVVALLCLPFVLFAQSTIIEDDFSRMGAWVPGYGDWNVENGRLVQESTAAGMARIDREVPQEGTYQIDFTIRYDDGGYKNMEDYEEGRYHAGFGVHIGVSDPPLRGKSWGNNDSYLLWLNLDTREDTSLDAPYHYGFRAQVYESTDHVTMDLFESRQMERFFDDPRATVNLVQALRTHGIDVTVADLAKYLDRNVPVSIRVDTESGEIGVKDPTAPIRYYFTVDPDKLDGDYISLRTNALAASFDNFTVTER
ncbi:MAG: hypothetical protein ACLFM6_01275 [Spirochaetaceae bacterium]